MSVEKYHGMVFKLENNTHLYLLIIVFIPFLGPCVPYILCPAISVSQTQLTFSGPVAPFSVKY